MKVQKKQLTNIDNKKGNKKIKNKIQLEILEQDNFKIYKEKNLLEKSHLIQVMIFHLKEIGLKLNSQIKDFNSH